MRSVLSTPPLSARHSSPIRVFGRAATHATPLEGRLRSFPLKPFPKPSLAISVAGRETRLPGSPDCTCHRTAEWPESEGHGQVDKNRARPHVPPPCGSLSAHPCSRLAGRWRGWFTKNRGGGWKRAAPPRRRAPAGTQPREESRPSRGGAAWEEEGRLVVQNLGAFKRPGKRLRVASVAGPRAAGRAGVAGWRSDG